jgi:putative DNA primase/helicase
MQPRTDIIKLASGKWPAILSHFGVEDRALSMKHSPCPMCGGKDRFRLIKAEDSARWVCNQCGSGDGMDLLTGVLGCDFTEAMKRIKPMVGGAAYATVPKALNKKARNRIMKELTNWWKEATDTEALHEYLMARSLSPDVYHGADLRVHPRMPYYDENGKLVKHMPCMLARVSTPDRKLTCLHRTYLHRDGDGFRTKKKMTKTTREWRGGSIKMFPVKGIDRLIVAEGIETALSVRQIIYQKHGLLIPCWSAISANGLEQLAVPENVKTVMVAGDDDLNFTGQKAAFTLANRLAVHDKRRVTVVLPSISGADFNDEIREGT